MNNENMLSKQINDWMTAKLQAGATPHDLRSDEETQKLKERALELIEAQKKAPGGEALQKALQTIDRNDDKIREKIANMVYEGRTSDEDFAQILSDIDHTFVASGCTACIGCVACSTCGFCIVCLATGVAATTATMATSTTATTAASA